ncbi:MAG: FixH family protein, partial [Nitrospirae bacterium]|nr:FixH family protein [Nitrospirota bacterium]
LLSGIAAADNDHVLGKELTTKVDGYTAGLSFRHGKHIIMPHEGENNVSLVIIDTSGKKIPDAKVSISYSMPDMPKFVSKADTTYLDDAYNTKIDLNMKGSWDIEVSFRLSDGKIKKVKFSIKI